MLTSRAAAERETRLLPTYVLRNDANLEMSFVLSPDRFRQGSALLGLSTPCHPSRTLPESGQATSFSIQCPAPRFCHEHYSVVVRAIFR